MRTIAATFLAIAILTVCADPPPPPPTPTVLDTAAFTLVTNAAVICPAGKFGNARIENAARTLAKATTIGWGDAFSTNGGTRGYVVYWRKTSATSTNILNVGRNMRAAFYGLDTNSVYLFSVSLYATNEVELTSGVLTHQPSR